MNTKIMMAAAVALVAVGTAVVFLTGPKAEPQAPAADKPAVLTMDDVAKHATAADCWVVVSGKAYNVTNMIAAHPGGADAIIANCGKDATVAFTTRGKEPARPHPEKAAMALETMLVGTLSVEVK